VGKTISAANSLQADVKAQIKDDMSELDIAKLVGKAVGEKAVKSGLEKVVLDRAGYKYHGRVAALADGAREAGLKF
jgi:large subunit ribosomal protein L18